MAKWTRQRGDEPPIPDWIGDFAEVRQRIKVRLCPPETLAGPGGQEVLRQDPAPGLASVLCYDVEGRALDVAPEHVPLWATPEAALFAIGMANLRRVEELKTTERMLPDSTSLLAVRGKTDFVSAQLVVADRFLSRPTPYGILACVPKDDLMLVLPILDARALAAAEELARLAQLLHSGDPNGLSPHLYWFRKNTLSHLPTAEGVRGVTLVPPPRFVSHVIEPLVSMK